MALPIPRPNSEIVVHTQYADLSTAGSAFMVAPCRGRIVRAYSVLRNAITTTNGTWTIEINGVAVTGTATVAHSGSAAGTVDTLEPTALSTTYVKEGDTIEIVVAGESDTTCITDFFVVIERD